MALHTISVPGSIMQKLMILISTRPLSKMPLVQMMRSQHEDDDRDIRG